MNQRSDSALGPEIGPELPMALPERAAGSGDRRMKGWLVAIALLSVLGIGLVWRSASTQSAEAESPEVSEPVITTVTALGRLEPQGEVINLSAPTASGSRVERLLVSEGDSVQAGQVIAVLDNYDRLRAAYEQAQEDVQVAEAQLAITLAGAKDGDLLAQQAEIERLLAQQQGDIAAQQATVARLESEWRNAEREYQRYGQLFQAGAIAESDLDARRLTLETAERSLQEAQEVLNRIQSTSPPSLGQAQARLDSLAEVRPVDVQLRQAEVDRAVAAMERARAEWEQSEVRSPVTGTVLDILTQPGEVVASEGIVQLGQTQQMYAIAEVYQSDIGRVQVGQRARITSDSLTGDLWGTVERIDAQVRRQTIINTDPSTNIDARVIEVHIALDATSSEQAASLTNLQVLAEIEQ